jgi:NSS family neurotransmitter:Na+ symporter
MNTNIPRSQWRSFNSYVLVTTGAIVGLGNVFQFPFLVNKYGGLFLLLYFVCQLGIALPLLLAELLIGRRGKQSPIGCFTLLAMECNANHQWRIVGWLCFLVAFFTLCYYTVSAAFPVGYFFSSAKAFFQQSTSNVPPTLFNDMLISHFLELEICFLVLLALAMFVVYRGINRGLEGISSVTVPLYSLIFLVLAVYVSTQGYFSSALSQLISINHDIPLMEIFLAALALAFLKYKVGMGTMIVYGSYLPYHVSFGKSTLVIVAIDAVISLLSYFVIAPLSLASHADTTLLLLSNHNVITIFGATPHGITIALFFFFATLLAAWTPIIAVIETTVVTLMEHFDISRAKALISILICVVIIGTFDVISHFQWENTMLFGNLPLYHLLKNITVDILTPITALFIAIFTGWVMTREATWSELRFNTLVYDAWRFLLRWVTPIAVILVLVTVTVLEYSPF